MFLRIAGRITINAASLNTQGGAGTNYIEMTKVPVVVRTTDGPKIAEVPAVSGNMVRHCHFVGFLDAFRRQDKFGKNLTKRAWEAEIGLRFPSGRGGQQITEYEAADGTSVSLRTERDVIFKLADADLYGFLAPDTVVRRTSPFGFSFLLPAEELVEQVEVKSIPHNRIVLEPDGSVQREGEMMLFKREYASAVYGFSAFLDLAYIGRPLADRSIDPVIEPDERRARAKSAIGAFVQLLSGRAGAALARGLPVSRVDALLVAVSERPIPLLVNGYYKDYLQESKSLLSSYAPLSDASTTLHVYPANGLSVKTAAAGNDTKNIEVAQEKIKIQGHNHWVDLLKAVSDSVEDSTDFKDKEGDSKI